MEEKSCQTCKNKIACSKCEKQICLPVIEGACKNEGYYYLPEGITCRECYQKIIQTKNQKNLAQKTRAI